MATNPQPEGKEPRTAKDWNPSAQRMFLRFLIPPDATRLFEALDRATAQASKAFAEIGLALRTNVAGLISSVSMPFTLANRSANDRHWQRIHSAERIRAHIPPALLNETDEELALRREREAVASARPKMASFIQSSEGQDALIRDTLGFLEALGEDETVIRAANELILQGVVLCWGAFEVVARDCFVAHLNARPAAVLALLGDAAARRRFELSKVSIETLAAHNFNVSERMGNLLAQQQDFSDVHSVKAVYHALFPDDRGLLDSLSGPDLRLLSLRRNLIVHHCGVIDETYAVSALCDQVVGEKLRLPPEILEGHIGTIVRAATHILDAVSAATQPSQSL